MEQDPKFQQSARYSYFPVMMPYIEEANYGNYHYLNISHLRAVGAFVYHISHELGSVDDFNQRRHINIFGLKARVQTMTDDGSEKRIDKIKRMMNMIMANIAPLVAHLARKKPFSLFYPDIVQEFYMWNLCSPFCLFVTDLRKRLSGHSKFYYTEKNRLAIYREIRNAIYNHLTNTYIKLKTRSNFYLLEPFLWGFFLYENNYKKNPLNIAINKIEREEFARELVRPPKDCRIANIDFINTTLSLLLNEADLADNFNRDYCRYILNKKVIDYKGNIEELCNQDPSDENKMMTYIFDEAERLLNGYKRNTETSRAETGSLNNR